MVGVEGGERRVVGMPDGERVGVGTGGKEGCLWGSWTAEIGTEKVRGGGAIKRPRFEGGEREREDSESEEDLAWPVSLLFGPF